MLYQVGPKVQKVTQLAPVYDAVTLWLPADMTDRPGRQFFDALTNYEERTNARTGMFYHVGKLDNLRVKSTPDGVSITGSLPRFHFGSNLETLTCQQTGHVLQRLSDTLGLPIESAKVTSFEFGSNLSVSRPPVEYFAHLGHASRYRRSEINMGNGNGLYYSNGRRELGFYDKLRELRSRKIRVPESLIGRNLIRYELRLLRKVGSQLATLNRESTLPKEAPSACSSVEPTYATLLHGVRKQYAVQCPAIKAATLYDPGFYRGLVSRWEIEYRGIQRRNIVRPVAGPIGSPRAFKDHLAALGLDRLGGAEAAMQWLRSAKQRGEIEQQHYKRNKQLIEELAASPVVMIEPELIGELDQAISETAERFR